MEKRKKALTILKQNLSYFADFFKLLPYPIPRLWFDRKMHHEKLNISSGQAGDLDGFQCSPSVLTPYKKKADLDFSNPSQWNQKHLSSPLREKRD